MNQPVVEWHALRAESPASNGSSERHQFAADLHAALSRSPKSISPKYFYDATGSALFEQICELPEYYPTRTEQALLMAHAPAMAACFGAHVQLIEYGAGSLRKVRHLLNALPCERTSFVPVDISGSHLLAACEALRLDHPGLAVTPVVADFTQPHDLPPCPSGARRVGFFPGSSIGNFSRTEAEDFLAMAARELAGGGLLIGIDLIKDESVLHAAYNDAAGVTAAFNLNLLHRARRELGAEFPLDAFTHEAFFNPTEARIEMHLRARRALELQVGGEIYPFAAGETLHTENSHKYTVAGFHALAARAGFAPGSVWQDERGWFALLWLHAPAAKPPLPLDR